MLRENAEDTIKEWVEIAVKQLNVKLEIYNNSCGNDKKTLESIASHTDHLMAYWHIYSSTVTLDTLDNELLNKVLRIKQLVGIYCSVWKGA